MVPLTFPTVTLPLAATPAAASSHLSLSETPAAAPVFPVTREDQEQRKVSEEAFNATPHFVPGIPSAPAFQMHSPPFFLSTIGRERAGLHIFALKRTHYVCCDSANARKHQRRPEGRQAHCAAQHRFQRESVDYSDCRTTEARSRQPCKGEDL